MTRAGLEIDADRVEHMACSGCGRDFSVAAIPPLSEVACPLCQAQQVVPARLGPFLLVKTLGRGGMGAVYKALDETLNRHVAVKVMRKEYGDDQQFLEGFLKEAQAAAALNHRNVAAIYSYGREKGQPYIVMELLEAGRLDEMIESGTPLKEDFVMETAQHVAEGMQAAHEIGLTHGDIKPANILFNEKGVAKVVDFGLASFAESHQARPGEIWGTPYYIPPEKVQGKTCDHRGDIYSLGGTIFHALAGTAPFEGETAKDVVKARLDKPAPSIKEHRPDVTDQTEAVIKRMLSRSPNRRYPTYVSLLDDLRKATRAAKQAAVEKARQEAEAEAAAAAKAQSRPVRVLLLVAAILAAGGVGAWWWIDSHKVPERQPIGHILRGGVLVPVYEDDSASTSISRIAGGGEEAADPGAKEAETEKVLQELANELAQGPSMAAMQRVADEMNKLDAADTNRFEFQMLQLVGSWATGQGAATMPLAEELVKARNSEGPRPRPGYPEIAEFMIGKRTWGELDKGRAEWSAGPAALVDLVIGLGAMIQGNSDAATKRFLAYEKREGEGWWFAFRNSAPRWRRAVDEWERLQKQTASLSPVAAIKELETFLSGDGALLESAVEARIAELKAGQAAQRAKEGRERAAQAKAKKARDEKRIADTKSAVEKLVAERKETEAAPVMEEALKAMETAEGKNVLGAEKAKLDRLLSVRPFLASALSRSPPPAPIAEVGGRVVRADAERVYLATVDGGGSKAWDDLSPGLYLNLLLYYVENGEADVKERAEMAVSVAYYCQVAPGIPNRTRSRNGFARKAVELDPGQSATVQALFPDLKLPSSAQDANKPVQEK